MSHKLPCEIIKDLMPSYVDGLTSEETNQAVAEHMDDCSDCRQLYQLMKEPETIETPETEEKEIDFLKKTKKRSRVAVIIGIILAALVVLVIVAAKLYAFGTTANAALLNCDVIVNEELGEVYLSGNALDEKTGVSDVKWHLGEDDILYIDVETTRASFFHKNDFYETIGAEGIRMIVLNSNQILWSEGVAIDPKVSEIYNKMNPYVGDMPANNELANLLGIRALIGPFKNELQTAEEPYGWKLIAESTVSVEDDANYLSNLETMGVMLLATIDNLGYVEFAYPTESGKVDNVMVTTDDASKILGQNVKEAIQSPADLQNLLSNTRLYGNILWGTEGQIVNEVNVDVYQNSDADIFGFSADLKLNDDIITTSTVINADESYLKKGDHFEFGFTSEDFDYTFKKTDKISIEIRAFDKDENTLSVCRADLSESNVVSDGYKMMVVLDGADVDHLVWSW